MKRKKLFFWDNRLLPVVPILTIVMTLLLFTLSSTVFVGCKKTDSLTANAAADSKVTQQFFSISPTEHPLVKRIVAEIQKRNNAHPFVADFARTNGFPIWDKAVLAPKPKSVLQRDGDEFELADTLVYIPLVRPDSLQINGSILAKIKGDSVFLKYVLAQDYKAYPFAGGRNVTTADQFTTLMFVLNREVFGHTTFTITDERLFADPSYPDPDTTTKQVSFDTSLVDNLNIPSQACALFQVRVCSSSGQRTSARTPGGNCYYFIEERCYFIYDDSGGWGGGSSGGTSGGSPSGSGSGSSGGGSIPHDYPCSSTGTCNPPGGGIGWFPTMPIEDDFPGDEIWQNTSLIDSSQNPCIDTALQKLKLISAKIPAIIREYYGSNPSFMVTYKTDFQDTSSIGTTISFPQIAWTPIDTTSNHYVTYFNSSYSGMTNLSYATIVSHEALHCQIMNDIRLARNDTIKLTRLAQQYGYVFKDLFTQGSAFDQIATQNSVQHHLMTTKYIDILGAAIYEYAQSININISLSHCKDLAWSGMYNTSAFNSLSQVEQDRLTDIISAEQDPTRALGLNTNLNIVPKGTPCN